MRKIQALVFCSILVGTLTTSNLILPGTTSADFNASNLIDDNIFTNSASMSADQIDTFLNSFPGSCISPNANSNGNTGFTTPDPLGYSAPQNQYQYGGNVTAGKAIHDAALLYSINPQVILSTLQKEQSIVSGSAGCHYNSPDPASATPMTNACGSGTRNCTVACTYSGGCMNIALGYGCPSYCNVANEGFSKQLTLGTWLLRFGQQRAYGNLTGYQGYEYQDETNCYVGPMVAGTRQRSASSNTSCSGNTPTYYDGSYTTQDGTSITVANGATSTLYNFTPFISGNKSFVKIFEGWFGSTQGTYSWYTNGYKLLDQTGSYYVDPGQLKPGEKYYVDLAAINTGTAVWSNTGYTPVRLGTTNSQGHSSIFCDTSSWIACSRPVSVRESSVAPGATGHFNFLIQAPFTPGSYRDYFKPLAENFVWTDDSDQSLGVQVVNPGTYSWYTNGYKLLDQSGSNYVDPGQLTTSTRYYVDIAVVNTGTATWSNSGATPVRFGTTNIQGHASALCDTSWLWCGRPTTLRETSVAPGQTGHFNFYIKTPPTPGQFREYFKPLAENYAWTADSNQSLGIAVH